MLDAWGWIPATVTVVDLLDAAVTGLTRSSDVYPVVTLIAGMSWLAPPGDNVPAVRRISVPSVRVPPTKDRI